MSPPPDYDEGRPGKGGPVTTPAKVITAHRTAGVSQPCALACSPALCSTWCSVRTLPDAVEIVVNRLGVAS